MSDSINNLFSFYREIGKTSSVNLLENSEFNVVLAEKGYWPQMIFDISKESELQPERGLAMAMEKSGQNFAVFNANDFNPENQSILRNAGIFPVKIWTLMELVPGKYVEIKDQQISKLKELREPQELEEFCNMTNALFMDNLKIRSRLIHELAKNPKIKFYGLYFNNELASVLLTFTEDNISGLYFIATKTEYRGKGLAEKLIRQVGNLLSNQKTEKVVLQAVQKALPLYSRIGFEDCGKLTIFWKK